MIIDKQLESLQRKYDFGPRRNRKIIIQQKLNGNIIPQDKLDDYIVLINEK
jgi:hypothetical protein